MKRRIWRTRIRFHDWMWDKGPAREAGLLRRACRKLPLWFSDPYCMSPKQIRKANLTWEPTVGPPVTFSSGITITRNFPAGTYFTGNYFLNDEEG